MIRARREAATVAVAIMLAVSAASCGPSASSTPGEAGSGSIGSPLVETSGASEPLPASWSPVTGILVRIDAAGLADVKGFTLRTADGQELTFRIGILENGAQFPPGHLAEHLATSAPVRVFFSVQEGDLVAYRLEDAG